MIISRDEHYNKYLTHQVPKGLVHFPVIASGGGVVDLTSDEDPIDEDGDTRMGDSTRVLVFLGGEISSGGKNLENSPNREPLSEDILGATTQRDTGSYYPKRYWELLPKEILGAITQRDTGSYYPKRYWDVLWENRGTSLDPSWSDLDLYFSGDEFLRCDLKWLYVSAKVTKRGVWCTYACSSLQGGDGGACKLLRWLLGDVIEVLEVLGCLKMGKNEVKGCRVHFILG
ncbi:hypothetical protein Tco_0820799 [Tanacetum coccineum]|uniref:Uncharacterized protein n=1 Tax=Tanacetum coccineum TaxID=301880 RepID=A0ABQ5AAF3_9ASTR